MTCSNKTSTETKFTPKTNSGVFNILCQIHRYKEEVECSPETSVRLLQYNKEKTKRYKRVEKDTPEHYK